MVGVFARDPRKFFQQFALARGQAPRRFDDHADQLVAVSVAVQIDKSLALEPDYFARLRSRWNLQLDLALKRRDLDFSAERGLRETDRDLDHDVVILAHEERMLLDVDDDVEVAAGAAAEAGLALVAQFEA